MQKYNYLIEIYQLVTNTNIAKKNYIEMNVRSVTVVVYFH